jgi:GNAT superfamily N-acetyltransferase
VPDALVTGTWWTDHVLVTTTYLQQTSPDDLKAADPPDGEISVVQAVDPSPEFHYFLYTAVGGEWHWITRRDWTRQQWHEWITAPGKQTWVLWVDGNPAGYAVLTPRDGEVEIENFGLMPQFVGRGLGGYLLTVALRRAWEIPGATRVWLHTCTLDGPHAMRNYEARGLVPYRTELDEEPKADNPTPGAWLGAKEPPSLA